MKVGFDLSILRHPYAGTARYAEELLLAMKGGAEPGDRLVAYRGWPRIARGHRWLRFVNLASDLSWAGLGIPSLVLRDRLKVWYSPSNIIPPLLWRPAVVTIHDVNFLLQPDAYERGYARYATAMIGRSARRARHVMTDSEFSRQQLMRAFGIPPERISVVYPGLDHALAKIAAPEPVRDCPRDTRCTWARRSRTRTSVSCWMPGISSRPPACPSSWREHRDAITPRSWIEQADRHSPTAL